MIFEKQVLNMYKGMMHTRCDDKGIAYYFSAKDFPGLQVEEYLFKSSKGHDLQGYIYNYDDPIEGRLIVFDHGFGGGHRSYMREIEMLCKHGYRVFAYDHTGCMESGGESPNGLAQSLCDLNDCLEAIKEDVRFNDLIVSVMGHSWGGFSTMNISALHPEISHVVSMSGFVSVELLVGSFFGGILKCYRKPVLELEKKSNPEFVSFNGADSLLNTNAKVLLIYSDNDKLVRRDTHFAALEKGLANKDSITLMLVRNKGHNPNYTEDAVKYLAEYSALLQKKNRKKELETPEQKKQFVDSFDWWRMTEQDQKVWDGIFECLDN